MKTKKLTGPMQKLHLFLQERMAGRHVLGTGSFNPKVPVKIGIDTFEMVMTLLRDAIDVADWETADTIAGFLPLYDAFLANRRYDGHGPHLNNMLTAIGKQSRVKAALHQVRLRKVVHPVAADRVFGDNERVVIMRTEHGWHDGHLGGTVKPGSGGYVVHGDDGEDYEIMHLRDIR